MKPFELYDTVFDDEYGQGVIVSVDLSLDKPLVVQFLLGDVGVMEILYTLDGRRSIDDEITLVQDIIKKSPNRRACYQDLLYKEF